MVENKETENKIAKLQALEQNIQNILAQKQTFQSNIVEIDNALDEVSNAKDKIYKIVGNIMIISDKDSIKTDLTSKKEIVSLRIKSIEKQENNLKEKASSLQSEVLETLKSKEDK